jgi:hypothetical protein
VRAYGSTLDAGAIAMCLVPVAFLLAFLGISRLGQPPEGYSPAWLERQWDAAH